MQYKTLYKVRYLGPTHTLGSRVKVTNLRTNEKHTIPYDYAIGLTYMQAAEFLKNQLGIDHDDITGVAEDDDSYYLITNAV